jgi:hypothetical protein
LKKLCVLRGEKSSRIGLVTGRADSLNVGIAAGVMMYEMMRRATTPQLTHDDGV